MNPPVYILSLPSAMQRKSFQIEQAQRLGFDPIWVKAVGVNDFSDEAFLQQAFDWQRPLKKTEVGCFLSHLYVWQKVANADGPAVILEDDVILPSNWTQAIAELASLSEIDVLILEAVGKKQMGRSRQHGQWSIKRLHLNSSGAGAYMLWPHGAQRLLQHHQDTGVALADVFMNETRGLRMWQIDPAIVIQMCMLPYYGLPVREEGVSQIAREQHSSPVSPNFSVAWRMKARRLIGEWRKAIKKMGVIWGQRRQFVSYLHHQRHH